MDQTIFRDWFEKKFQPRVKSQRLGNKIIELYKFYGKFFENNLNYETVQMLHSKNMVQFKPSRKLGNTRI